MTTNDTSADGVIRVPSSVLVGLLSILVGSGAGYASGSVKDEVLYDRVEKAELAIEVERKALIEHATTVGHADNTRRVDNLELRVSRGEQDRRDLAETIESIDRRLYTVCLAAAKDPSACLDLR